MSMPANRFIPSPPIVRSEDLGAGARNSCLSVRESNLVPGYRASLRTPDEGAHLVTRGIILNPRYGDPPPELPISLATVLELPRFGGRERDVLARGVTLPTQCLQRPLRVHLLSPA